ncbi:hypothetical protein PMAYCL1PPCAC_31711, partial [Pristionchus mayeri]
DAVCGVCRYWGSPSLCLSLIAAQIAGIAHHAVMIAFCSIYRYYVLSFTRKEPELKNVLLALIGIHLPTIIIYLVRPFSKVQISS